MKTKNRLVTALLIFGAIGMTTISSCTKPNGTATFWTLDTEGVGYVTVTISGVSKDITVDKTSTPACDASGCASFSLSEGTHSYSAVETTTGTNGLLDTWSGSVTITSEGCNTIRLDD